MHNEYNKKHENGCYILISEFPDLEHLRCFGLNEDYCRAVASMASSIFLHISAILSDMVLYLTVSTPMTFIRLPTSPYGIRPNSACKHRNAERDKERMTRWWQCWIKGHPCIPHLKFSIYFDFKSFQYTLTLMWNNIFNTAWALLQCYWFDHTLLHKLHNTMVSFAKGEFPPCFSNGVVIWSQYFEALLKRPLSMMNTLPPLSLLNAMTPAANKLSLFFLYKSLVSA